MIRKKIIKKNKRGSNGGMEPKYNRLILDNIWSNTKYLNVSFNFNKSCAGMVEWLTHSSDTRSPQGLWVRFPLPAQQIKFSFVAKND